MDKLKLITAIVEINRRGYLTSGEATRIIMDLINDRKHSKYKKKEVKNEKSRKN